MSDSKFFSGDLAYFSRQSTALVSSLSVQTAGSFLRYLVPALETFPEPPFFTGQVAFEALPVSYYLATVATSDSKIGTPSRADAGSFIKAIYF